MRTQYEYCVCMTQNDRVTFVNHQWIGSAPMDVNDSGKSLEACPYMWQWLTAAGQDGWDLVSVVVTNAEHNAKQLFLKRVVE